MSRITPRNSLDPVVSDALDGVESVVERLYVEGKELTDLHLFIVHKPSGKRFRLAKGTKTLRPGEGSPNGLYHQLNKFLAEMRGREDELDLVFIDERQCSVEELAWLRGDGEAADKG